MVRWCDGAKSGAMVRSLSFEGKGENVLSAVKKIIVFKVNTKITMSNSHEVNEMLKNAESALLEEKLGHIDDIQMQVNAVITKIEALIENESPMGKIPLKSVLQNMQGILLLLSKIKK
jgi:hypothetical protein